jgi:hypothetical protein
MGRQTPSRRRAALRDHRPESRVPWKVEVLDRRVVKELEALSADVLPARGFLEQPPAATDWELTRRRIASISRQRSDRCPGSIFGSRVTLRPLA